MATTERPLSERESVLANAIGWVLFKDDGRPVEDTLAGVPSILLDEGESARVHAAAIRALADLRAYDRGEGLVPEGVERGRATGC